MIDKLRRHDLMRMVAYLQPNPGVYVGLLFLDALNVAVLLNVILAFMLKQVIDSAVQGEWAALQHAFVLAGLALFVGVPAGCYIKYRISVYTRKTVTGLRLHVFNQVVNLPFSYFEGQHSGDLISRLTNDLRTLHDFYIQRMGGLIFVILYGIITVGSIFRLDWRFGLISLLLGLITTRISARFIRPMRQLSDAIQATLGRLTERLVDLVQGLRVAKMFQIEALVHQEYATENNTLTDLQFKRARLDALLGTIDFVFSNLKSVGLLALGLFLLLRGYPIQVGTIAAILYLQGIADYIFGNFGNVLTELQKALAGVRRVLEVLDAKPEPLTYGQTTAASQRTIDATNAMVGLHNISFAYAAADDAPSINALQAINLTVAAGQTAALVGPSGGGKSTLLKMLLGFYPLQEGQLTIAGQSSAAYPLSTWRDQIAYVPQEAYLFAGTIAENIRYGKPTATEDEIIAAAQAAHAHAFILEQPQGYATPVGERGAKLSGGQRQRIAIARALLKDAPILLLDEATSALDSESEQLVQDALARLMQGRTTIAVAHRLSTIEHADRIYVMDQGAIVEAGSHAELLAQGGLYAQLYHAQFRTAL
ncbi:MAG: ABC transporter ATP-binding protein [Caldilineaceae bacterium]